MWHLFKDIHWTYVSVTSNAKSSISSSSSSISGNLSNISFSKIKWHVEHANSAPQAPVFNNKKVMLQYQIRKQQNSHEIYIFSRIQCHPSSFIRNEEHTFQFNIIIMCDMKQILSNVRIYSCFISVGINVSYSNRVCWCQSWTKRTLFFFKSVKPKEDIWM